MEQIKELLEILKETPEMALWGVGLYFLFMLLKMASWVGALTLVSKLFIKRYFDHQERSIEKDLQLANVKNKESLTKAKEKLLEDRTYLFDKKKRLDSIEKLSKVFRDSAISDVQLRKLEDLLKEVKSSTYIHNSDIDKAITKLKSNG